jgi:hypothetical protein
MRTYPVVMDQDVWTQVDLAENRAPWSRIVDVSKPAEEHEIAQWGYPLWLSPGDMVQAGSETWRVIRSRLELPKLGLDGSQRAVLHIEVERAQD